MSGGVAVKELRCEYRVNPLGIDIVKPRLSWIMESGQRGQKQIAYQILAADSEEKLRRNQGELWDSGKVESEQSNQVVYEGEPLKSRMRCYWKVRVWDKEGKASAWSEPAMWTVGLLSLSDWQAKWIGYDEELQKTDNSEKSDPNALVLPPPPYLRREFLVGRPVKRAVVYASALGLYELHINGKRIGQDYFAPGWTDYTTRVYYQSYEVTDLIKKGSNAIGAILADGWYAGYLGFGKKREHYGSKPRLFVQLEIEYENGHIQKVVTDGTWKARYGPLLESDFLMGEIYDGRQEMPGWDTSRFDDSSWAAAAVTDNSEGIGIVQSYPGETVQKIMEIKPKELTEPEEGVYVFDMGQNFAGWVRLKVNGKAGTKVVLRFAEILNPDGSIYTENLREARCTDTYILKGTGKEFWEPQFTFHGFRYVEVTGYPGKPGLDAVTGVVVHSAIPIAGSFECSSPMVNQLYSNIVWSQRGNFIELPTDCPQRDERLGWTGDAQIFIRTATYNMDVSAFFTKWLVDLEDAQSAEGGFPDVAPRKVAMGDGTAAWGDAGVVCPWTIYEVYGDKRVLERHYESMKKWIGYLKKNSKDLLRPAKGYGDWVSIASDTPKDVIATAYFAYSTHLVSKAAAVLGKDEDAEKYEELFEQIKSAFNKAYVSEDGRIKGETQTCYLLGLYFDLLPEDKREPATQNLIEAIRKKDWHLSTGFVGLSYLVPTLAETGHLDIAYRLLNNDTFPSWGYSIKNGATTIWERWDGWTEEKGFQTPGMNSFNHYAFGSIGRWLFGSVAGIDTDGPGYKRIIIQPRPGGGLDYAKASYKSINGTIVSGWKIKGDKFTLNVTIPANTTATVYVPAGDIESVTEGGKPVAKAGSVSLLRMENDSAVFAVGSGHYRFVSKLPD
ncbi:MAG: Bacterial alpha-L-rhamnosidase [Planctomycetes bacterium]|nr:Bacterial alpha-L-rhamnosidase [Planctomycetota bacterium]